MRIDGGPTDPVDVWHRLGISEPVTANRVNTGPWVRRIADHLRHPVPHRPGLKPENQLPAEG